MLYEYCINATSCKIILAREFIKRVWIDPLARSFDRCGAEWHGYLLGRVLVACDLCYPECRHSSTFFGVVAEEGARQPPFAV